MSIKTLLSLATGAVAAVAMAVSADAGTMRLGMTTWVGYGPMFLARDKGFFKENGLDVDLRIIEDASIYMAAIAAGECEPIDDHRASAEYRREMVGVLTARGLTTLA